MEHTLQQQKIQLGKNSLNLIEECYQAAYAQGMALHEPHNVNGVALCWSGRLVRAFERAPSVAPERSEQYRAAVLRLSGEVERLTEAYTTAWNRYEETANRFNVPIKALKFECHCEGCQLVAAQEERMAGEYE